MTISNKQRKFIIQNHEVMHAADMAARIGVSREEVEQEIQDLLKEEQVIALEPGKILDKISYGVLFLLVVLIPFAIRRDIYDQSNLPQTVFALCSSLVLGILLMSRGFHKPFKMFLPRSLFPPLACLAVFSGMSAIWAVNDYEAMLTWAPWAICLVFFSAAVNILHSRERCVLLLKGLFFSGVAVALLGIMQHLGDIDWVRQAEPPASTFTNRNMAVHFIVLTLPLGVGFFLQEKKGWLSTIFLAGTTFMLNYLFYTSNRAGWACLLLEIAVFSGLGIVYGKRPGFGWFMDREKKIAIGTCLLIFFLLFNMTSKGFKWQFEEVFNRVSIIAQLAADHSREKPPNRVQTKNGSNPASEKKSTDTSLELRLNIWTNTLEMIKEHPLLGVGAGNHKVLYPIYSRRVVVEKVFSEDLQLSNVHNDYLQITAELGLLGLALMLWLAGAAALTLFRLLHNDQGKDKILILTLAAGLAGISLNATASFPFQRMVPVLVITIYLAVMAGLDKTLDTDRPFTFWPPRWTWLFAGIAGLSLFIFSLWAGFGAMEGDKHYKWLEAAESVGNWDRAISEANLVLENNPYRVKASSYLGRAYIEKNMPERAIPALEAVVREYPYHMNALLNLGVAYGALGENQKALDVYARVLEIKPDYAKVHNNLGNVLLNMKKPGESVQSFTKASELDPQNSQIWMNLGIAATQAQDYEKAAMAFVRAARLAPGWIRANKNAGYLLMQIGKTEQGFKYLKIAEDLENYGAKNDANK